MDLAEPASTWEPPLVLHPQCGLRLPSLTGRTGAVPGGAQVNLARVTDRGVLPPPPATCVQDLLDVKFCLNMRKNFFPLRVTEPWPRLPREAVESPSLQIFQTRLDKVLCSLL